MNSKRLNPVTGIYCIFTAFTREIRSLISTMRNSLKQQGRQSSTVFHTVEDTGWSRAWIINFFARLKDGEKAYENVIALLTKSTLNNLFDNHPPFQIDGNFVGTAGITEMLRQSHAGEVELLLALPTAWKTGYAHGLMARGGFEININWEDGKLKQVRVISKLGNPLKLSYKDKVIELRTTEKEKSYIFNYNFVGLNRY